MLIAWLVICTVFLGFPSIYYLYMKNRAAKPWKLAIDEGYEPSVAILVPTRNEEKTVRLKLENLSRISYPDQKIETVIVNDASTDNTLQEVNEYIARNSNLRIRVLNNTEHIGKANCLNNALKDVTADVVIISDADCFWSSDILVRALPYLSSPDVGAITARELLLNHLDSWVTKGEQFYDNTVQSIRVGESKVHSTIFFQGGFAAYKHSLLNEFNHETDDSGTALDIVQKNNRALLIPEIGFYTMFPTTWKNKIALKIRRASQLQRIWTRCLKLLLHKQLLLPKRIAIPEIFMHVFNPFIFVMLIAMSALVVFRWPVLLLAFLLFLFPALFVTRLRVPLLESFQSNCILIAALPFFLTNRKFRSWKTTQQSRVLLNEQILKEKKLI